MGSDGTISRRGQEKEVGKLLAALDQAGVAVSAGSACSAHHFGQPSGVVLAMGYGEQSARGLVRVTWAGSTLNKKLSAFSMYYRTQSPRCPCTSAREPLAGCESCRGRVRLS
jgi:cysteine sulfinate desulfinase/cysteine desulfurase-like protein